MSSVSLNNNILHEHQKKAFGDDTKAIRDIQAALKETLFFDLCFDCFCSREI